MKKRIKMNNIIYRDIYFKCKWTLFSEGNILKLYEAKFISGKNRPLFFYVSET